MKFILLLTDAQAALGRLLDRLRSLLLLGTRLWVAWSYLAPHRRARGDAALLALPPSGLAAHDRQRAVLSGFMLLPLTLFGPGRIVADAWLERRSAARCRPVTAALAS